MGDATGPGEPFWHTDARSSGALGRGLSAATISGGWITELAAAAP